MHQTKTVNGDTHDRGKTALCQSLTGIAGILLACWTTLAGAQENGNAAASSQAGGGYREEFKTLDDWKPRTFDDVDRHTEYSIVEIDGGHALKAVSDNSASGVTWKKTFDVYKYPRMRWRWKISNIYETGDATDKKRDDYANRVYVTFKYDPDDVGFVLRAKYGVAKRIYGEYPPHSTLNYFWANKEHDAHHLVSQYTDRAMLVPVETGAKNVGKWVEEEVNIIEDYKRAFGEKPPREASIAIMIDSDNTGESASGWIDYIELLPAEKDN